MKFIHVNNISYNYSQKQVLKKVTLTIDQGKVLSLLGPNGSGKTTLLKMIMGFYRPSTGQVILEGRSISDMTPRELARRIAYVPQVHRLAFSYRVMDVILMGRVSRKPFFFRYSSKDRAIAARALEQLSIVHLKDRPYTEISGGERQLTLIARAMAQGADTFVLDEPVNGLDYGNQIRLLKQIADLAEQGYTFIQTSHFPEHAIWISDRVVMLQDGQIIANGSTQDVINGPNLYRLYKTPIGIVEAKNGMRVCVPRLMRDRHHSSEKQEKNNAQYQAA
ncbi:ABC transporter ATP-binding protein [Desulfobacula toluolica]|uniref:Iron(III) dicitrate ABC transporter, ATP-binding protein n=1 Tax=Desulfobacula toluolica (strain DSM 7467 / Tol2) TaxID=651182 RepID=K0NJC8_DESTT|nr:ABC transporter ATP-binding protein [Desulfobacula toluolica]CCK81556.1 iron(III) dicitrate ABC transporter, ATP-binding protein [Desulfobacula toluolica Tol2]